MLDSDLPMEALQIQPSIFDLFARRELFELNSSTSQDEKSEEWISPKILLIVHEHLKQIDQILQAHLAYRTNASYGFLDRYSESR